MNTGFYARRVLVMGMLTMACIQPAMAADVKGTVFEETITLGGKELKLNGAGMRTKSLFSIYAMGLYLSEKKTSPEDVQSVAGPKRVKLVYQRELNSDEFGQKTPPVFNVPNQTLSLVLRQHRDVAHARIDAVAERKVDDVQVARKGHRRLGPPVGQLVQSAATPPSQHQRVGTVGQMLFGVKDHGAVPLSEIS